MNIEAAKNEISNTLRAYHQKDDRGNYCFPVVRQRPILLMGPPGIGKTAILEQVAQEAGVGLFSYTLTHHTRQSAVGLPHIEQVEYAGKTMTVTEYTMSEMIADIYKYMDKTGKTEGILFLDEINCVSETLAPTMLQLLQNKRFGSHEIPQGWMIVTAGNPPEYNRSVRELDVATLDRVRVIPVEPNSGVWLEYAQAHGVHGSILSYLSIRPEDFYRMETTPEGKFFVTARGWEDLSELLKSYERLNLPVSKDLIREYLQTDAAAGSFYAYYLLYRKYDRNYGILSILDGTTTEDQLEMAQNAGFEERFALVQLFLDALSLDFQGYIREKAHLEALREKLLQLKTGGSPGAAAKQARKSLGVLTDAGLCKPEQRETALWVIDRLEAWELSRQGHSEDPFPAMKEQFSALVSDFTLQTDRTAQHLHRAFVFLEQCFGNGQELLLFVTKLTRSVPAMTFLAQNGSDDFLRHSAALQVKKQEQALLEACQKFQKKSSDIR